MSRLVIVARRAAQSGSSISSGVPATTARSAPWTSTSVRWISAAAGPGIGPNDLLAYAASVARDVVEGLVERLLPVP